MTAPLVIRAVEARVFRHPLDTPVQTSFGTMTDRPMLLVGVTDAHGETGWGEVWCNFPGVSAEHRARLVDSVLAPLRSEEHTSELQSLMRISYAVFCLQ